MGGAVSSGILQPPRIKFSAPDAHALGAQELTGNFPWPRGSDAAYEKTLRQAGLSLALFCLRQATILPWLGI
jgi:hypothetical protein